MKGTAVMRWVAGVATGAARRGRRRVDRERRPASRLHAPHRRRRSASPGRRRSSDRHTPRRPASLSSRRRRHSSKPGQRRQDRDRVRGRRNDARGRGERRAQDDLQGRELHPRGAHLGEASIAIAQAATVPARVPQIGPNNSSPALTDLKDDGYYFRTMPSDTLQAPILARLIKEELGAGKTISLAGRNDAFGTGLLPILKTALEKIGMKTQGPLLYDPTAASYNSEADDIVKGNPDAYFLLPGELREDRLGPAPDGQVQRSEALRRRRLALHHPVVHSDRLARGCPRNGRRISHRYEGSRGVRQALRQQARNEGPPDARLEQLRRGDESIPRCGGGELGEGLGDRQADPGASRPPRVGRIPTSTWRPQSGRSRPARTSTTTASAGRSTSTRTATSRPLCTTCSRTRTASRMSFDS